MTRVQLQGVSSLQVYFANLMRVLRNPGIVAKDLDIERDALELERVTEILGLFRLPPAGLD